MAKKELKDVLQRTLDSIRCDLRRQAEDYFEQEIEKVQEEKGLKELVAKRAALKKKITKHLDKTQKSISELRDEMQKIERKHSRYKEKVLVEINEVDDEINSVDEEVSSSDLSEELQAVIYWKHHSRTTSTVEAAKRVLNSDVGQNYFNFLDLYRSTKSMFELAVSPKEQRGIILELQNRDWYSIGVKVPELPHFNKFDIQDGKLHIASAPALPQVPDEK